MNIRRLVLIVLVIVALVVPLGIAQQASAVPLAQKKAAAKAKAQKIRHQLDALDVTLEKAVEAYNLANIKLSAVEEKVRVTTRALKVARYQLGAARDVLRNRVIGLYKQRPVEFLDVILQARSFDELTTELKVVRDISMHDSDVVDVVKHYESQVVDKRNSLVKDRMAARILVKEVSAKRADIETQIAARKQLLKGVEKEIARIEKAEREAAARAAAAAAAASAYTWRNPRVPVADAGPGHPEVIAIAKRYLGIPYVYGAADPKVGFDCSGLVMYCYAQIGITLPHYSGYQQNMGLPVAMNALIPGDLVFMGYPVSYHVGMYVGGGMTINAPHTGDVVSYRPLSNWQYAVRLP